jgi:hypothetical protein
MILYILMTFELELLFVVDSGVCPVTSYWHSLWLGLVSSRMSTSILSSKRDEPTAQLNAKYQ